MQSLFLRHRLLAHRLVVLALALAGCDLAAAAESPGWLPGVLEEIRRSEYHFAALDDGSWTAPNRAGNLRSRIGATGLTVVPRLRDAGSRPWRLSLAPVRYGRRGSFADLAAVPPSVTGARVEYRRAGGSLVEWYENDARGLQQGFTLSTSPAGREAPSARGAGSPVVIEMAFSDQFVAHVIDGARSALFTRRDGTPLVRYADLRAWDATGRPLEARLASGPERLFIEVEDHGASYPVTIDPLLTTSDWTAEGGQENASFGFSVAMGHFNNDAFVDLAVGAYRFDGGLVDEGKVFVYHGTATIPAAVADWTAESNQAGAQFGYAVAAARLGGDSFHDLIVGAPSYDTVAADNRGRVFVWYGSAAGLGANGFPGNQDWFADQGQSNSQFGYAVAAAGDVNANGVGDLIVGAPQFTNPEPNEGRAFVYHSLAAGLPTPAVANWTTESNQAQARLGSSVSSAGRANGDATADVVIGAPQYGPFLGDNRGRAFVWYGGGAGLGPLNDTVATADWLADSAQPGARFGTSVATAGDVNGNGLDEVLVGAPLHESPAAQVDEGWVFLYAGSGAGLSPVVTWSAQSDQSLARLGAAVAGVGDADGDGFGDIALGAPLYDNVAGDNRGRVFLWQGSAVGLGPPGLPGNADWAAEGGAANAGFGIALAAGDANGDARADLLIGAETYTNGEASEGAALLYLAFAPPTFLEFGPAGDPRRIEATGASYTSIIGLVGGEYSLTGSATVKMGNCGIAADCTRAFSFADLEAVEDPADLSSTGEPAFRITAGTATVDTAIDPIDFPAPADLAYHLLEFELGAAGADIAAGGLRLTLPDNLTSSLGQELTFFTPSPIEQDLDFNITLPLGGMFFWFAPKDYPFQIAPQFDVEYVVDRDSVDLGLSDLIYVANETGDAEFAGADTRCSLSGACQDEDNDGIFGLGWSLNQYSGGGPPPGSIGTPYFDRTGLRATLYLLDDGGGLGGTYAPLFPDGVQVTLNAASTIEVVASEPTGGSLAGTLQLDMRTGAVITKESIDGVAEVDDNCSGEETLTATFTGGQMVAGGQIRIATLSGPAEVHWGGPQVPLAERRGFFAGGLGPGSLSFYAPGTAARVTVARPTASAHLLAERDDGDPAERGTYAGLNIGASATTGLDTSCPEADLPDHSLAAGSAETRLYARRSGVSGVADAGSFVAPGIPFQYMGYQMTIGRYGVSFLDNRVQESGVVVNSVVIPHPSDVQFFFGSPAEITSCANFGPDLGEMANAGDPQQLACWQADFTPRAAGFRPADPPGGLCQPAAPDICPGLDDSLVRYLHVSATAPLDLDSEKPVGGAWVPQSNHLRDIVSMDFTPAPDGPLVCSDIIPVGLAGSVRNEMKPGYGFGLDMSHAHLMPLDPPACNTGSGPPAVADADVPRYDVVGEYLFPFYGGTSGCTRLVQGVVGTRLDCADASGKVRVSRKILAGLIDLDFDVSFFDALPDDNGVFNGAETAARFVAESAKLDFKFFKIPASVKLFGDLPGLPGLPPDVPRQRPELYLGFLSDLGAYAEARAPDGSCGAACIATLTDLLDFDAIDDDLTNPGLDVDDLLPGLRAGADLLGGNLRTLAADTMRDTVGDILPADMALAAGRVKGAIEGIREASGALEPFKALNLTGPGAFREITDGGCPGAGCVKDWVLERIDIAGDIDILDFVKFKGFVQFNTHTANTEDDRPGEDTADVTVGANNVDLGWIIDGVKAKTVQATFRFDFDPPTLDDPGDFRVWGFDGGVDLAGLKFGDVVFDELGFSVGMGNPSADNPDDDYYYLAGLGRGKYKAATAAGGFFIGKSIDIAPLERIDPDVGEVLVGLDSLTGIYAKAEASFPIFSSAECFPYRLTAGGGAAFWLFSEGPTFGAKVRAYATGSLACVVSARADLTLLGGLTDDVWHLSGYGFVAGGVGMCEPGDWDTRRDVLRDDWCLSCVLDGEFRTDSESNSFDGDFDGPDCSGP